MAERKPFDVVILGATGFTGRQAVRALGRRGGALKWTVAGRDAARLAALGAPAEPIVADTGDVASLDALAAKTRVLVNFAGPYAPSGEAVVVACIAQGTHYLDLSGETFWVREMIARHHRAAQRAGVKVMPTAGYESLPFDLAVLWGATRLAQRHGAPCRELKIVVSVTGTRSLKPADALSGGTVASLRTMLEYDTSDCVRNPACLMPDPGSAEAAAAARRNAIDFVPRFDADVQAVVAPTLPAPFVNPPMVLRSVALLDDPSLFAPEFAYREATNMAVLVPRFEFMPHAATLPLQWAAAASLAAPLANLSAAIAGPLQFQRGALDKLVQWLAPRPGQGPSDKALDGMGFAFDVIASATNGAVWRGRVEGDGHPGYRAAAEMIVAAACGLADGSLGKTPHAGVVTPATGLGLEAVAAMASAGVRFVEG